MTAAKTRPLKADQGNMRQVTMNVPRGMYQEIEDFRFQNRFTNRNEAIHALLAGGLEAYRLRLLEVPREEVGY